MTSSSRGAWIFSRRLDLLVFTGSAVLAFALIAAGKWLGIGDDDTPPGFWLAIVLGVDVSHVWSTGFRTYADPLELQRRPALYFGTPLAIWSLGVCIYMFFGAALFWRLLAYTALFHFIRQQYGWMRLYRRRAGQTSGAFIDTAAIYLSTLGPVIWWHAAPARNFHWFLPGDFLTGLPPALGSAALALEAVALVVYTLQAVLKRDRGWGKHLLVLTTAACWYLGIVACNSDYIFTVTNVLIHGIPYFALTYKYGSTRFAGEKRPVAKLFELGWPIFYAALVAIALLEEGLWDGLVWHDHPQFFGAWNVQLASDALALIVPLLAVPQGVHYVLDGFIWRTGPNNPQLADQLDLSMPGRAER